ncbi:hypothetical protein [Nannocystis sp. SCPEA4]|uniref:WD40 repeat domain-containing protein n=1 Tax=Nannocystis sp. SCPEA4 TaxID=2996787 RepID=UPI0022714436|nr:hypothetical protein [Nannocystis sp. SCPEA4]MCY1062189.1 hypothetical protein [Nannocystis sp. SCPEA4]
MPWTPHPTAPIIRLDAGPRAPVLQIFHGKPHALAFLADGSLVVGMSRGLTVHDPSAPTPPRAAIDVGGKVEWMVAHPDGESVVAAVSDPRARAVVRAWPATARVVTLLRPSSHEGHFCGGLSPDGAQLVWLNSDPSPVLSTVDALTGATLRELELPPEFGRAVTLAVRSDGAVYLTGEYVNIIHPDGRREPRLDSPFYMRPQPLFADERGGMICSHGHRFVVAGGLFESAGRVHARSGGGTVSYDRARITFHDSLDPVQVWDVASERVIFRAEMERAIGSIPGWHGQSAAASASHVAAIDHADASITIWPIDQPDAPVATMTGYSQGVQRLMFHGAGLTVHTCQPANTLNAVIELDRTTGAAQMLARDHVHDIARTRDGQRLLVLRGDRPLEPVAIDLFDAAGAVVETLSVQKGAGELALAPDDAMWGVVSHTYPAGHRQDPTCHAQWRPFGASKWTKTLKLRGRWQCIALADTAAAVAVEEEVTVVAFAKGKTLLTTKLPKRVARIAISRDGAWVGVACFDALRLIRVATGAVVELAVDLPGERTGAIALCFQDDAWLFVAHASGAITQHRVPSGEQAAALFGHTDAVRALAWADGALWSGSEDGTILRWGDLG